MQALCVTSVAAQAQVLEREVGPWDVTVEGKAAGILAGLAVEGGATKNERVAAGGHLDLGAEALRIFEDGQELGLRLGVERTSVLFDDVRFGAVRRGGQGWRLEDAHLIWRHPWVRLEAGRGEGAAQRLAVGLPGRFQAVSLGSAGGEALGLSGIQLTPDLTGFSAKVSGYSPRILGLRVGGSFTPVLRACDAGLCAGPAGADGRLGSELAAELRRPITRSFAIRLGTSWTRAADRESRDLEEGAIRVVQGGGEVAFRNVPAGPLGPLRVNIGAALQDISRDEGRALDALSYGLGFTLRRDTWALEAGWSRAEVRVCSTAPCANSTSVMLGLARQVEETWQIGLFLQHAAPEDRDPATIIGLEVAFTP